MIIAIVAICAGMIVGWLTHSSWEPRETSLSAEEPRTVVSTTRLNRNGSLSRPDNPNDSEDVGDADEQEQKNEPPIGVPNLRDPEKMKEFKAALEKRTTLEQRATQIAGEARQSVIDAAKLDEAQIVALDGIIDDLNQQLEGVANKWIAHINENKTLNANDRTRMAHDISGVLVKVSDTLDAQLPNWRDTNIEPRQLMRHSAFAAFLQLRMTGGAIQPRHVDDDDNQ